MAGDIKMKQIKNKNIETIMQKIEENNQKTKLLTRLESLVDLTTLNVLTYDKMTEKAVRIMRDATEGADFSDCQDLIDEKSICIKEMRNFNKFLYQFKKFKNLYNLEYINYNDLLYIMKKLFDKGFQASHSIDGKINHAEIIKSYLESIEN